MKGLSKEFRGLYAVNDLHMTVPVGAIYGFIGENGSGKSTTEKLICGQLVPQKGQIKLFGKDYTAPGVRLRIGSLIENAGCFPNSSVWDNLMKQTKRILAAKYDQVSEMEDGLRVYDAQRPEDIVSYLYENGILVSEIKTAKII